MRSILLLPILWLAIACAPSANDSLVSAREALASGDTAAALGAADAGLAAGAEGVTAWGLQLVRLEALAREGRSDDTLAQLDALASERPEQMTPDQYSATADQLRAAGEGASAAQALDLGLKRFPGDAALNAQIEAVKKAAASGSDELEMLRSLGYIE